MLLGHWIEMNAIGNAGNALKKMAELLPNKAIRIIDSEQKEEVSISEIEVDDIVEVKAGESIPADGMISQGSTSVDESLVTGESKQVVKNVQDEVIGGSINGSGTVHVKVTATGENGYLSQVMGLVNQAQNDKSDAELLSDKVAGYLFFDDYRGQGLGEVTMLCIEDYCKQSNIHRIGLHVFGHNKRAVSLYHKLGFQTTNYRMEKVIEDDED